MEILTVLRTGAGVAPRRAYQRADRGEIDRLLGISNEDLRGNAPEGLTPAVEERPAVGLGRYSADWETGITGHGRGGCILARRMPPALSDMVTLSRCYRQDPRRP